MAEFYCGVGSRQTPQNILVMMESIAQTLGREEGMTLRSGHAPGADQAFERGADGQAEIFLPWKNFCSDIVLYGAPFFGPTQEAVEMAAEVVPHWRSLSPGSKNLHARNCHQVLGVGLDDPVKFVVCWTKGGKLVGGTATAIRLARRNGIKVYNLARSKDLTEAQRWIP